jgi:hypothetical protein
MARQLYLLTNLFNLERSGLVPRRTVNTLTPARESGSALA